MDTEKVTKSMRLIECMKKNILILGAGFGGSTLLKKLQKNFKEDEIEIKIVSDDNYFLFTPMLPEVTSGMLHPSDISIPIRTLCTFADFFHAKVTSVDLEKQKVKIQQVFDQKFITLEYDYLVIAMGSTDNFFGNQNIEKYFLTIKTLEDALSIRNHVINALEGADVESDAVLQDKLSNFVIVGGGFAGVEVAAEINHFVKDAAKHFYKKIQPENMKVFLISARNSVLPELGDELGAYSLQYLKKSGIEVVTNTKAIDAGEDFVLLGDNTIIPCATMIWAGGVIVEPIIKSLKAEHGPSGRIIVNDSLQVQGFSNVFAIGDAAHLIDKSTGDAYPPTAQIAIKQAKHVASCLKLIIKQNKNVTLFTYANRGVMATIGKRTGVALLRDQKLHGIVAWFLWRLFYLTNLPTQEKKIRVGFEWFLDLFFQRSEILTVGKIKNKIFLDLDNPIQSVFDIKHEEL